MKTATIREAKDRLGALIDEVKGGETVVITDGGVAVAQLVTAPVPEGEEEWLARLERRGIVSRPKRGPLTAEELPPFAADAPHSGAVDAVLAERDESW